MVQEQEDFTKCVVGCENPLLAITNSAYSGSSAKKGKEDEGFLWGKGQAVTMKCKRGYTMYGSSYRECIETKEGWEDFYGAKSWEKAGGLYWDPTTRISYCSSCSASTHVLYLFVLLARSAACGFTIVW